MWIPHPGKIDIVKLIEQKIYFLAKSTAFVKHSRVYVTFVLTDT